MAFMTAPEKERFSLDDPEAGRKLIENLDRRKVRLAFSELCWHFRCDDYDEKMRLRAFLLDLSMTGEIVEVLSNLYCRPALTGGSSDPAARRKAVKHLRGLLKRPKRPKRPRGTQASPSRDGEAKALLDFAAAQGERVTTSALAEEGARIGMARGRVSYIIQHLRTVGALRSRSHGVYDVVPPEAPAPGPPVEAEALKTDDA